MLKQIKERAVLAALVAAPALFVLVEAAGWRIP